MSQARAISYAARSLAEDLKVAAIAAFTRTGRTAHLLSQYRPRVPIYAFTQNPTVYQRLALYWGVTPVLGKLPTHSEELIEEIEKTLRARSAVAGSDLLVIVGGLPFRQGFHTNFVKLHTVNSERKAAAAADRS